MSVHRPDPGVIDYYATTIELWEHETGEWSATQGGVGAVGRGDTALAAVMDFCERVGRGR